MNKNKTKISVIISSIILMLVLVINIGLTFAWYTDHKDYSNNIDFGYIKIDVNNSETDGYFSNTDNYYNSIKPGDYLLRKDVKFNLKSGSDPAYIRAKYEVDIVKTKNLWNTNGDFSDLTLYSSGGGYYGHKYQLKPNTTYTFSCSNSSFNSRYIVATVGSYYNNKVNGYKETWLMHTSDSLKLTSTSTKSVTTDSTGVLYLNTTLAGTTVNSANFKNSIELSFTDFQLEEGTKATSYEPYIDTTFTQDEINVYNYLKYKNLELGENLFDAQKFVDNAISLGYNSSQISVNKNYKNAINFGQIAYSQNYTKLDINCAENVTYQFSCDIDTTNLQSNATSGFRLYYTDGTYDTIGLNKSTTSLNFTSKSGKTVSGIGSSGWSYSGSFVAYNIKLQQTTYHWSEKLGDYYYLLGSDNLPLAIDKTTDGYYTFLTKENSQIDYDLEYDATNVNKSDINVNITIEAIQVPSVTKSITGDKGVEAVLNELNGITKPTDNYKVTFVYGDNQTAVTSSVAYSKDVSLPSAVTSLVSKGFTLWNGGLKIIGENGYNHSYIKDNKICNVTENLTLYEASEITLYNVTFKNGTDTIQTSKVISGKNAEYLGNKPIKKATDKVYTFIGWSKTENGEVVSLSNEKITQDTTFYAIFTDKPRTYKINYNLDGGVFTNTPTTTISSGKANLFNEDWLLRSSKFEKVDTGYNAKSYAITDVTIASELKTILKPNVQYTFTRKISNYVSAAGGMIVIRSSSGALLSFGSSINGEATKTFSFTQEQIDSIAGFWIYGNNTDSTLIYNWIKLEEGAYATEYEPYGARNLPTNEDVYKEGYTLEGWYLDGAFTNKVTSLNGLTQDVTLYAKWVMATCGVETTSGKLYFDNLDDAFTYALTNNDSKVIIYKTNCEIGLPITIPSGKTLTIVSSGVMSNIGVYANIINNGTLIIGGKTNSLNNLTFVVHDGCGIESNGNLTIYGGNFNRKGAGKSLIATTGGKLNILGGTFEDLVVDSTNSFIKLANTVANINDATMKNENTSSQKMFEVTENSVVTFDGETNILNPYGLIVDTSTEEAKSNVTININNGEYNGAMFIRVNNILNFNNGLIKQTDYNRVIHVAGQFNMFGGTIETELSTSFAGTAAYTINGNGGVVNIKGGNLKITANNSNVTYVNINATNGIVVVENLTIQNTNTSSKGVYGFYLSNSTLTFNSGSVITSGASTGVYGIVSGNSSKVTINNGEFAGDYTSVIFNSSVESINISNGTFGSNSGNVIRMNAGSLNISGGVFSSISNNTILYKSNTNITISGGTFNCKNSLSGDNNRISVLTSSDDATNYNVTINGGNFSGGYGMLICSAGAGTVTINNGVFIVSENALWIYASGATTTLNGGIIKTTNTENANAIYIEGGNLVLNNASITGNIYYETKDNLITVNSKLNGSYVINFKEGLFDLGYEVIKFSNGISATTYKNNFSLVESMGDYILYPNTADDSLCLSKYFTVTFANDDGTVLKTEKVAYGDVPTYNGATPTKESDESYVYTFSGWNQEFSKVTGDITYYAQYSVEPYYVTLPEAMAFKNALTSSCGFNYDTITSLTFSNSAPAGYTKGSKTITSGIDVYYNTDKAVVLVTKGGILAPSDSSSLFSSFNSLKEIKFNGILSTKNVTNMNDMFYSNPLIEELDLSSFETNNLQSFSEMFEDCNKLKTVNLSNFILPSDVSDYLFSFCYELETIYAPKAIGENTSVSLLTGSIWGVEGTNITITGITKEVAGKKLVVSGYELTKGWQSQITWTAVGALTNGVQSITEISFERTAPTGYSNSGKKINNIEVYANGTKVAFVSAKNIVAPTNSSYLFSNTNSSYYLTNLTSISFNNFDTKIATDMSHMFSNCSSLSSLDLSTFDTSNVKIMNDMFTYCSSLTSINLTGKFTTDNVTALQFMFTGCSKLTRIDLSNFETNKVTNFTGIFSGCGDLAELDLSSFNFSSVTSLSSMFNYCSGLTNIKVDWSTITNKVKSLDAMFRGCSSLKALDLRTLNTSGVTVFTNMFNGCSSLQDLDLTNFVISSSSTVTDMLTGATNIVRIIAPNSIGKEITLPGTYYINGTGTGVTSITTSDAGKIFVKQKETT